MAKYANSISYNISTKADLSGINQLQAELIKVTQTLTQLGSKSINKQMTEQFKEAKNAVLELQKALASSFNPRLGLLDGTKFKAALDGSGVSIKQITNSLQQAGTAGQKAFNGLVGELGKVNTGLRTTSSAVDKIATTFGNTVRWGITASIWETFANNIRRSVDYVKELDSSLNNIRIVTGASNAEMSKFAQNANDIAKSLGAATTDVTNAALMYAQNGFNEEDYTRLAELTTKVSNITKQDTATTSEQLTALMNGYQMSIDEVEKSVDQMSLVAAQGASDLNELATAEQKVAAVASTLGVSQEQLISQISTIISVTRQAPETVGNALKTIYSRLGDLKLGETLEDNVTLGTFSSALEEVGVQVLDQTGNMRNMGTIIEDLMGKWQGLTIAQKQALGVQLAGKNQYTQLVALMENQEMYNEQLQLTANATGTLDKQQAVFMDSYEARLQKVGATWESIIGDMFDPNSFKPGIDALQTVLDLVDSIVQALGGGGNILTGLLGVGGKLFSKQIASGIGNLLDVHDNDQIARQSQLINQNYLQQLRQSPLSKNSSAVKLTESQLGQNVSGMLTADQENYNRLLENSVVIDNAVVDAKQRVSNILKEQLATQEELSALKESDIAVENETGDILLSDAGLERLKDMDVQATKLAIAFDSLDKAANGDKQAANGVAKAWEEYASILGMNEEQVDMFKNALNKAQEAHSLFSEDLQGDDLEAYKQLVGEASQELENLATHFQDTRSSIGVDAAEMREAFSALGYDPKIADAIAAQLRAQGQQALQDAENKLAAQSAQRKLQIQQITEAVGAVGELTFAWQNFQGLGSIWLNADLTEGEKLIQTIQNLAFTIPSVIDAFKTFRQTLLTLAPASAAAASAEAMRGKVMAAAKLDEATATRIAAEERLKDLMSKSAAPGIDAAVSNAERDLAIAMSEETAAQEAATLAGEKHTAALKAQMASALKATAPFLALAAALGVIAIAWSKAVEFDNSQWDGARKAADEAKQSYQELQSESESLQGKLDENNKRIEELKRQGKLSLIEQNELDRLETSNKLLQTQIHLKETLAKQELETAVEEGRKDLAKHGVELVDSKGEYFGTNDLEKSITKSKDYLTRRNEQGQSLADNQYWDLERRSLSDVIAYSEIYKDKLVELDAQKAKGQITTEQAEQKELEYQATLKRAEEELSKRIEAISEQADNLSLFDDKKSQEELQGLLSILDSVSNKIDEVNGKTTEISSTLTPYYGSDEYNEKLKSFDFDPETFGGLRELILANNEALNNGVKQIDNYRKELTSTQKTLSRNIQLEKQKLSQMKQGSKEYEEQNKIIKQNESQLENNRQQLRMQESALEDAVLAQARLNRAVDNLTKSWKTNIEVLQDTSSTQNTINDAINNLMPDIQDLLNMDLSSFSQDQKLNFIVDTQNLADFEAAINGDIDALNRLKQAAAEEILVHAGIDPASDLYSEVMALIIQAQNGIPDIVAGASINTGPFFAALNAMIAAAVATGQDITAILSALEGAGIKAEVTWKEVPIELTYVNGYNVGGDTAVDQGIKKSVATQRVPEYTYHYIGPTSVGGGNRVGGGTGTGGGNGGNSGGGGKTYEPKTKDPAEIRKEWYEKINQELDNTSGWLDRIQQQEDRIWGKQKIDNLAQQNKHLQRQNELIAEKYEIQKQEAAEVRGNLETQGFLFDSEGVLLNTSELRSAYYDQYNALVKEYNEGPDRSEARQQELENQMDELEKQWEKNEDNISRWMELWFNEMWETYNQIEEIQNQITDNVLKMHKEVVQLTDDWKDLNDVLADIDALDFGMGNGFKSESAFRDLQRNLTSFESTYYSNGIATLAADRMFEFREAKANYEKYGTAEARQDYLDSITAVKEAVADTEKMYEDIQKGIVEAFEEIGEALDSRLEQFEGINDELDHWISIIELTEGEKSYDNMIAARQAIISNNDAQLDLLQKSLVEYKDYLNTLEEGTDEWTTAWNKVQELNNQILELTEDSLQRMRENFENEIDKIREKWVKDVLGETQDMDWLAEQWELIGRNSDQYLDDMNSAFEIQKLENSYLDLLDGNSGNVAIQKQISEQMKEQLKYLREKDKLSQYDVDYANAQLDILQKTIALEDAQNNKNQMKLRRNAQGNYSYVYTANEGDVRNAQQALLEAQLNAYNLTKDNIIKTQEDTLSALQSFYEKVDELAKDNTLSEEERTERLEWLKQNFYEFVQGNAEQLNTSEAQMLNDFEGYVQSVSEENRRGLEEITEQLALGNDEVLTEVDERFSTTLTKILDGELELEASTDEMIGNITDTITEYTDKTDELMGRVYQDYSDVNDAISSCADSTKRLSDMTNNLVTTMSGSFDTLKDMTAHARDLRMEWDKILEDLRAYLAEVGQGAKVASQQMVNEQSTQHGREWKKEADGWYLYDKENGQRIANAWDYDNEWQGWYYTDENGKMVTGHQTINGTDYYFGEEKGSGNTGKLYSGWFQDASGTWYSSDTNPDTLGAIHKNSWEEYGDKWYYLGDTGAMAQSEWVKYGTDWYYQDRTGATSSNHWGQWGDSYGYVGENGKSVSDQWVKDNGNWYYINSAGIMAKNQWVKDGEDWYYVGADGKMQWGGVTPDGYTLANNGKWLKDITKLATGGYTGEWGDTSGRIAMLHQKELVLNEQDTANILSAVDVVRSMANAMTNGIYQNMLGMISGNNMMPFNNPEIAQNIHIEATFPNAVNADDIENAIYSLSGDALQYINPKY